MFEKIRGRQVHVVSFGSGAPAILGISGAIGNWEIWQQPFELLSQKHRVIAFDHFGAGETRVPDELVTFEEQVGLVEDLLDALSIDHCVLCGDSNMVGVAVEVAARHPERIDALALVAGNVVYRASRTVTEFVAGLRSDFDATVESFVAYCIPEDDSQHIRAWLRDIIHRTGGERAARLLESLFGTDLTHRLAALTMPAVVIHGERDVMPGMNTDAARAMAAAMPNCTLEVLPGIGHVPTLTRPREVAEIIERLVARASGSPAGTSTIRQ